MKKLILAAVLCLMGTAYAQGIETYCGSLSRLAAATAEASQLGVPLHELQAKLQNGPATTSLERKVREIRDIVILDAYYEWSALDKGSVHQFAYMKCKNLARAKDL